MKVIYLLEGSALYGGVKVVYQHVRALRRLGVAARVAAPAPPGDWFPEILPWYDQLPALRAELLPPSDIAIGTMWTTVPVALAAARARAGHLCQCYEGQYEGVRPRWPEIEAIYRQPAFKLAVSPHLVALLEQRFGTPVDHIPQPFEPDLFSPPARERAPGGKLRVLVAGHYDVAIKGIEWGLRALRPLHDEGTIELVRLALDPHPAEQTLWPEAERHHRVPPHHVPELMRGVDVYCGLSTEVEGFGLPALEAMGCARPVLHSDIAAARALDPSGAAMVRVPFGDGEALRSALRRLHGDPDLRRRLGAGGRALALGFTEERTGRALLRVFERELAGRGLNAPARTHTGDR